MLYLIQNAMFVVSFDFIIPVAVDYGYFGDFTFVGGVQYLFYSSVDTCLQHATILLSHLWPFQVINVYH